MPAPDIECMMMDPAVKTGMAVCVLLAGICAASIYRHEGPSSKKFGKPSARELLIRTRLGAARTAKFATNGSVPRPPATVSDDPLFADRPATVVTPLDHRESPPPLSPDYPDSERVVSSRWGASMEMMLPAVKPADDRPPAHRIVDGDTLASLAERYLGSADRACEIFEANRGVLSRPELLPIGVELKIPPKRGMSPLPPGEGRITLPSPPAPLPKGEGSFLPSRP